jgi:hypothetical protein
MPPNRLDVIRVDPFFIEGERNQYANRGVAFIILLNCAAAIVLLAMLAQPLPSTEGLKAIADAMLVFSVGAVVGLTSALLAYLNRTFRIDQPDMTWRRPLRWLAVACAVAGAVFFLVGMNMARIAVLPQTSTSSHKETLRSKKTAPQRQPTESDKPMQPPINKSQPVEPQQTEPNANLLQPSVPAPQTQPTEPPPMQRPPQPVEPQPNAAAPEPSVPQTEPEVRKAQPTEPPTTQRSPRAVEPQQTEPQEL